MKHSAYGLWLNDDFLAFLNVFQMERHGRVQLVIIVITPLIIIQMRKIIRREVLGTKFQIHLFLMVFFKLKFTFYSVSIFLFIFCLNGFEFRLIVPLLLFLSLVLLSSLVFWFFFLNIRFCKNLISVFDFKWVNLTFLLHYMRILFA